MRSLSFVTLIAISLASAVVSFATPVVSAAPEAVHVSDGDLVEIMIVPLGKEMSIFSSDPQIQSVRIKDGKATLRHLKPLEGTDYVVGYVFAAEVIERDSRITPRSMNFFITYSSFSGFIAFGEGERSPLVAAGNFWNSLSSKALNGGWQSFEMLAPQRVLRQNASDEIAPPEVGAILFVRWSRSATTDLAE